MNGDHKHHDRIEREKKKLIAFEMIHEGVNAVGGQNRRLHKRNLTTTGISHIS